MWAHEPYMLYLCLCIQNNRLLFSETSVETLHYCKDNIVPYLNEFAYLSVLRTTDNEHVNELFMLKSIVGQRFSAELTENKRY